MTPVIRTVVGFYDEFNQGERSIKKAKQPGEDKDEFVSMIADEERW